MSTNEERKLTQEERDMLSDLRTVAKSYGYTIEFDGSDVIYRKGDREIKRFPRSSLAELSSAVVIEDRGSKP
jgi:hypothetical protein